MAAAPVSSLGYGADNLVGRLPSQALADALPQPAGIHRHLSHREAQSVSRQGAAIPSGPGALPGELAGRQLGKPPRRLPYRRVPATRP